MKKPSKKPVVPDLKSATREVLNQIAGWAASSMTNAELFGTSTRRTQAEWAVLEEARKLAINYIRTGAKS